MYTLVLIRHGQSLWNAENRFTGWQDVDLSSKGKVEAKVAARALLDNKFTFDLAYTSVLKRAIRTMKICLTEMKIKNIPIEYSWRLNERHYGALQGLNKAETAKKYGDEQVLLWRRSYDTPPPQLQKSDTRWSGNDSSYSPVSYTHLTLPTICSV